MAPFAGYESFQTCVSDQMKKHKGEEGFKMENAQKICGYLKHKIEKNSDEIEVIEHKDNITYENI